MNLQIETETENKLFAKVMGPADKGWLLPNIEEIVALMARDI